MNRFFTGTIVFLAGVLVACGSGSSADGSSDGPTLQQFTALEEKVADLEERLAALETTGSVETRLTRLERAVPVVVAGGSVANRSNGGVYKTAAATNAVLTDFCKPIGNDSQGNALNSNWIDCLSNTGLVFSLNRKTGELRTIDSTSYLTNDCTGTAYVYTTQVGESARLQGGVFRYADAVGTNVGYFLGTTPAQTIQVGSQYGNGRCYPADGAVLNKVVFEIQPNDPDVTGLPGEGVPGPILFQ